MLFWTLRKLQLPAILLCLITFFYASSSSALIRVTPAIITFPVDNTRHLMSDVTVYNNTSKREYISTTVKIVSSDANGKLTYQEVTNPLLSGLLLSPNKFILRGNQKKILRIRSTQPLGKVERRYAAIVSPVEPSVTVRQSKSDKVSAGIRFTVAYGVLVIAPPQKFNHQVKLTRKGRTLTVSNEGNLYISLTKEQQCTKKDSCAETQVEYFIAPGKTITTQLAKALPVSYLSRSLQKQVRIQSN